MIAIAGLPCALHAQENPAPAAPSSPDTSQAVKPKAGDPVFDKTGARLGAVASVSGGNVVLTTAKGNALIPTTALALNTNGLTLNMLKADVEAEIQTAKTTSPKN
jgi:hypothetical protein